LFDLYCSYFDFINSKPIVGEYVTTGEDYQSIKVLGKILLNEYMVPFEFASILLLVAMIERIIVQKRKNCKNKMNNILNQIGIENYIPERNTFLYWRFWCYTDEMPLSYLCQLKLC
jgi:hypothetical protein